MRSSFESQEWVDRIAANPSKERDIKNKNMKINAVQHAKLSFATTEKKQRPDLTFEKPMHAAGQSTPKVDNAPKYFQSSKQAGKQIERAAQIQSGAQHTANSFQSQTPQLHATNMKHAPRDD